MPTTKAPLTRLMTRVEALHDPLDTLEQVEAIDDAHAQQALATHEISLDLLEAAPWQSRRILRLEDVRGLAEDMEAHGQLQPIRVRRLPPALATKAGMPPAPQYQIVYGHKRVAALRFLGARRIAEGLTAPRVRAEVVELGDAEARLQTIGENEQRGSLTPYERALDVMSALEAHRELGLPDTLDAIRPRFNALSDQPLSYLRTIGERLGDSQAFVEAGIINAEGAIDWEAIGQLSAEALHDAANTEGRERAALLRGAVRRMKARAARQAQRAVDGETGAGRPSRRGRRTTERTRTKAELLTQRGVWQKKLRTPLSGMSADEARQHLESLKPMIAALEDLAKAM